MLSMRSRWPFILCVVHVSELVVVFAIVHVVIPWLLPWYFLWLCIPCTKPKYLKRVATAEHRYSQSNLFRLESLEERLNKSWSKLHLIPISLYCSAGKRAGNVSGYSNFKLCTGYRSVSSFQLEAPYLFHNATLPASHRGQTLQFLA